MNVTNFPATARFLIRMVLAVAIVSSLASLAVAESPGSAGPAVNALGVDLYQRMAPAEGNLCLSPYSIGVALAMTMAGANGETRREMAAVLHMSGDEQVDASFAALRAKLAASVKKTEESAEQAKQWGGPSEPIALAVANRLFPQTGYPLRPEYLERVRNFYGAPPEPLDFVRDAAGATKRINNWVAQETRDRIRNLIPAPLSSPALVLVNALYFKAPWEEAFRANGTEPQPFHVRGGKAEAVPMMSALEMFGYAKKEGFTAVTLPYRGREFQLVVLLPDAVTGLPALERRLTAEMLLACADLPRTEVDLRLPKFKFEPPTMTLAAELKALGMKSAFDQPAGSADFSKMALKTGDDSLAISEVFHKTFIAVDEKGTEAAAATAVAMVATSAAPDERKPIEVKVDRPFLYAIQHGPSGVCLFLGRVTDPR